MEYSMGQIFGPIWSASKLTLEVLFNHPIECSISQKFDSIWSIAPSPINNGSRVIWTPSHHNTTSKQHNSTKVEFDTKITLHTPTTHPTS